ncbi:MAG: FAD-dependent oxidoreductase [Pirellulales bacterium]
MSAFSRNEQRDRASDASQSRFVWDIVVIGGGASGVGIALDAATRGYQVCLVERFDFGKGTSSRSTKLVHGGVRYLRQGNISLVREALHERALLLKNAPHVSRPLPFIIPCRNSFEWLFYAAGMKVYDSLAGRHNVASSRSLNREDVLERAATLDAQRCYAGVLYYDGQFDDSRLLINLAQTAVNHGACVLNYAEAVGLEQTGNRVTAVRCLDHETGEELRLEGRVIINAAGPFCDAVRRMASEGLPSLTAASQGIHLVLDKRFLPGNTAVIVPKTPDGRVVFLIPWHDRTIVGTTDTPISETNIEPRALETEIDFLLELASRYLVHSPQRSDVLSVFAGIRPLVQSSSSSKTSSLSRDHTIEDTCPGMLTITGGKWTTYRRMAEDCVNRAADVGGLERRPSVTRSLPIHGSGADRRKESSGSPDPVSIEEDPLAVYGSDRGGIEMLIRSDESLGERIDPRLNVLKAQIVWSVRREMARTLDDVLCRRTRAILLDADATWTAAQGAVQTLAEELNRDQAWQIAELERFRAIVDVHRMSASVH